MKIGFFCIKGLETFIAPISKCLKQESDYEIEEHWLTNLDDIQSKIAACDVIWLEWANEMAETLTNKLTNVLQSKIVIVRLHSYEALIQKHRTINWEVVNAIVFVAEHVKKYCDLEHPHEIIIPNGIDLDQFEFSQKTHGNDIGFIGLLSHKKGIMLLVHAFNSLPKNFKLHIAGEWQDDRERIYFSHIIKEIGLSDRIDYVGQLPHDQVGSWMASKNYILCTSPWEGHPVAIAEAMASGIKPLIHNFWGAKKIYPPNLIWSTFSELNQMVSIDSPYNSYSYCQYINSHYSRKNQIKKIKDLIQYLNA